MAPKPGGSPDEKGTPLENSRVLQRRLQELESLFELLPVGVAIARDRECREMVANAAFCRAVGVEPGTNPSKSGEQAGRLPFRIVENGVDVQPENLPMQLSAREGIAVSSLCHIIRDDGNTVALQGQTVPLIDRHGDPCGSVGVFVDVSEREKLIRELQAAQETIRTLSGLLPICAHCKSIRNAEGRWQRLESYFREHAHADFTHTICPSCLKEHYGHSG
jgi:hypothetical protein